MSRLFEDNLKKKLIHNGFWLYAFAFLIAPSGYLLKLMIARELPLEDIGLFYSILGLISIIATYNDLGLTEALQYFLPKYLLQNNTDKARSLIRFTRLMQFITGILISGGLYLSAPWLAEHYFESSQAILLLRIFCLYFFIINLHQVLYSLFYATQQVKRGQLIEFVKVRSIVIFTVLSIFVRDIFSVMMYAYFWLGGVIIGIIIASIGSLKLYPWVFTFSSIKYQNSFSIKERLQYGWRVMLGQSASTLYGQVNQQLVLILLGASAAGIRAYYLSFFTMAHIVIGPLAAYLFPLLNELHEKKNQTKIHQLYTYLGRFTLIFGIGGGILAYFISPRLATFLFGETFSQAGKLFQIFAPWIFTIPAVSIIFADIASRGRVKQRVFALAAGLIVLVIATYICITKYGIVGSVYGHIIGNVILLACVGRHYRKGVFQK